MVWAKTSMCRSGARKAISSSYLFGIAGWETTGEAARDAVEAVIDKKVEGSRSIVATCRRFSAPLFMVDVALEVWANSLIEASNSHGFCGRSRLLSCFMGN